MLVFGQTPKVTSKFKAMSLFEKTNPELLEYLRREARHLCYKYGSCAIDDLREHIGEGRLQMLIQRSGKSPTILGAVFSKGMFKQVASRKSRVTGCHGRPIGIFKLK